MEKHETPQRHDSKLIIFFAAFIGTILALCFFCFGIPFAIIFGITTAIITETDIDEVEYEFRAGNENSENKILTIPLKGVILGEDETGGGFFDSFGDDYTYGYEIKSQFINAAEQEDIKGIILEIDSPGGTIFGSQAIYDGVEYYQDKTGNPVIAYVQGVAASGSYWGALPADTIIADYGSAIGSIGVLSGPFKFYDTVLEENYGAFSGGIVTQNGIESFYITAGDGKDMGDPYRELSEKEVSVLQTGVNNVYDDFVALVSNNRDIPEAKIRETIGAYIYDNDTAIELGLIDTTGSKDDAYNTIVEMANIDPDDVQFVFEKSGVEAIGGIIRSLAPADTSPTARICSSGKMILAYHGNVETLCN